MADQHTASADDATRRLGARIRSERERRGLSAGELAHACSLDGQRVAQAESGARPPDSLELSAIADALGVAMDAFFDADRDELTFIGAASDPITEYGLELAGRHGLRAAGSPPARW